MNEFQTNLAQCLEQTVAGLRCMKRVLEREEAALSGRDPKTLDQCTRDKEVLANGLNALGQQLENLPRSLGLPPGLKSVVRLLAAGTKLDPAYEPLRGRWREIMALARHCRKQNEMNGAYIGLLSRHARRSLDILHDRVGQDITYGPDGLGRRPKASRELLSV
jgi:flagella synthesis protein FlgN